MSLTGLASAQPSPGMTAAHHVDDYLSEPSDDYSDETMGAGCCDIVSSCGGACDCCGRACWVEVDSLIWWTKGVDTPPLVTTGSTTGRGVLGDADTEVLFGGGDRLLEDSRFGGRVRLGTWVDSCQTRGIEVSYLRLEDESEGFSASDADYAVLSRPIFNSSTSAEDALSVVFPGATSGSLQLDAETQFQALDVTYLFNISQHCGGRCDFVVGYRYQELSDTLLASQSMLSLAGASAGSTIDSYDRFATRNTFNGGLFGIRFNNEMSPCWSLESSIGFALGGVQRRSSIDGSTTVTDTGNAATTTAGGLLAQPTNIGDYSDSRFGASYEVGVKLKRKLSERAVLSVGYTYMALSNVFRAADQIDTNVNPTQFSGGSLTGSATPTFPGASSGYWAQGLSLGLEATF
ncbi:BBP7 family outer membrane beta-barrel protein [Botrimarina colliarenosi]|nr:BBP7 family outer membrane beta-barrel protein [Botrimarina colliarenosi]